jgi:hypothetical protein
MEESICRDRFSDPHSQYILIASQSEDRIVGARDCEQVLTSRLGAAEALLVKEETRLQQPLHGRQGEEQCP